jgi:imidazolonepropionase
LLTLRGPRAVRRGAALQDLGIIPDGSVLIRGDRIEAVGPTRRIENLKETRGALEIPLDDMVVMPGFVDPNVRLTLHASSHEPGGPRRRRRLGDFYTEVLTFMRSCLHYGTLNVHARAASGLSALPTDVSVLRQIAKLGNNPIGMSRVWRLGSPLRLMFEDNEGDSRLQEVLSQLESLRLAESIEFEASSELEAYSSLWPLLDRSALGVHLLWHGGSSGLLRALLTRSRIETVCAPNALTEGEIQVLSESDSIAIFSLGKALHEERNTDSVRALAESGGAISLSSGYDAHATLTFSMQMVLTLAELRLGLTPEQAITAATINAAHAIGRANEIGTLEVGKKADIIVLNVPDYREISRRFGTNHVGMGIREGVIAFNRTRWKATTA